MQLPETKSDPFKLTEKPVFYLARLGTISKPTVYFWCRFNNFLEADIEECKVSFSEWDTHAGVCVPIKSAEYGTFAFGLEKSNLNCSVYDKSQQSGIYYRPRAGSISLAYGKRLFPWLNVGMSASKGQKDEDEYRAQLLASFGPFTNFCFETGSKFFNREVIIKYENDSYCFRTQFFSPDIKVVAPVIYLNRKNYLFFSGEYKWYYPKTALQEYRVDIDDSYKRAAFLGIIHKLSPVIKFLLKIGNYKSKYMGRLLYQGHDFGYARTNFEDTSFTVAGKVNSLTGRTSFMLEFSENITEIDTDGKISSWPLTTFLTELIGQGKVLNFDGQGRSKISKIDFIVEHRLCQKLRFVGELSCPYMKNTGSLKKWERKSGLIGLIIPADTEQYYLPESLEKLWFPFFSFAIDGEYKNINFGYSFKQYIPFFIKVLHDWNSGTGGLHFLSVNMSI